MNTTKVMIDQHRLISRISKSNLTNRICWTMKNLDSNKNVTDAAGADQSIFTLTILEKIKETILKLSQGSIAVL